MVAGFIWKPMKATWRWKGSFGFRLLRRKSGHKYSVHRLLAIKVNMKGTFSVLMDGICPSNPILQEEGNFDGWKGSGTVKHLMWLEGIARPCPHGH
jgi:hypothetical protein